MPKGLLRVVATILIYHILGYQLSAFRLLHIRISTFCIDAATSSTTERLPRNKKAVIHGILVGCYRSWPNIVHCDLVHDDEGGCK